MRLWPRREDGEVLLERLESLRPGLTQAQDPTAGEISHLAKAVLTRILNRRESEKKILQAKKAGTTQI